MAFLLQKVKNWFSNRLETKRARTPFRLRRQWTGKSVYSIKSSETITDKAKKLAAEDGKGKKPIAFWSKACKDLYDSLSTEEQDELLEEAQRWNVEGPDAKWRPLYVLPSARSDVVVSALYGTGWPPSVADNGWLRPSRCSSNRLECRS